ncbi:FAD-dependent monooxygenase [Streptomyces sp. NPDC047315]|uniref:FAD-dependent monooxygenase n=1 Tax=Streptomyces sp. NPDC047315 TaxID=3155142 RepID=UPI0033E000BA
MTDFRILIAGAGIAGLALARALADHGIRVEVVERDVRLRSAGAGLYLPANAVRALTRLGYGPALAERAHPVTHQRVLDHRGRPLTGYRVGDVWGRVGHCCALSRQDLHALLRAAVAPDAVRTGVAVQHAAPDGTVTFSDGRRQTYDLVVGADGVNSAVRHSAFPRPAPRFLGQICWRFLADHASGPATATAWTARLGPGGRTFLTVPIGCGRAYCYADVNSATPASPVGDWRDRFADFTGPVPDLLAQGADAHMAPLYEVDATSWARPRTVLIGDAAHACSPSMAQGGAMALEDVVVLAEFLAELVTGAASPPTADRVADVLAAYRLRRAARVHWVLAQNHRRDRARNLPTPLRNLALRVAGARLIRANHVPLHSEP